MPDHPLLTLVHETREQLRRTAELIPLLALMPSITIEERSLFFAQAVILRAFLDELAALGDDNDDNDVGLILARHQRRLMENQARLYRFGSRLIQRFLQAPRPRR
jgi:hypothetical protein